MITMSKDTIMYKYILIYSFNNVNVLQLQQPHAMLKAVTYEQSMGIQAPAAYIRKEKMSENCKIHLNTITEYYNYFIAIITF